MFGALKYETFGEGLTAMPQGAASAWAITGEIVGATYKPLLFYATQIVKGTNYYFVAEQTLATLPQVRRVVKVVINEFGGEYEIINVEEI